MAKKKNGVDLDEIAQQILGNASKDRIKALELLEDAEQGLTHPDKHVTHGDILQKYLAKANKATDQMIRIFEVLKKSEIEEDAGIDIGALLNSDTEDGIFDNKSNKDDKLEKIEDEDEDGDSEDDEGNEGGIQSDKT